MDEVIARVEKIEGDIETLESRTLNGLGGLEMCVDTLQNSEDLREKDMRSLETKVMDVIKAMQNQLNSLRTSLEGQGRSSLVAGTRDLTEVRVDLPKPKEFKGVRDAKEVENFLCQMEPTQRPWGWMMVKPSLSDEELLFNFIDGLQNWAKYKLQHRGVKDVNEAIVVAESLNEYKREKGETFKPTSSEPNHRKCGGDNGKAVDKGGDNKF